MSLKPPADAVGAIIHISDLHFGRWLKARRSNRIRRTLGLSEHSYALCVALCTAIVDLRRKFGNNVVAAVTGDLTASAHPAAFEVVANYLLNRLIVAPETFIGLELDDAAYVVPGNHDMFIRSVINARDRAAVFWEYFQTPVPGVRTWTSQGRNVVFYTIDSNRVAGTNILNIRNLIRKGEVGERQRGDLLAMRDRTRVQLRSTRSEFDYDEAYKVALVHHHVKRPADEHFRRTSELIDARQVIDLLMELDIDLVLCGHQHASYEVEIGTEARKVWLSCAGTATKDHEVSNSFKVYYFLRSRETMMHEFVASSLAGVYQFATGRTRML